MATISIPESPLTWDINYVYREGYVGSLYFEGRTIYTRIMPEGMGHYEPQEAFLDIVADKLRSLLEDS